MRAAGDGMEQVETTPTPEAVVEKPEDSQFAPTLVTDPPNDTPVPPNDTPRADAAEETDGDGKEKPTSTRKACDHGGPGL